MRDREVVAIFFLMALVCSCFSFDAETYNQNRLHLLIESSELPDKVEMEEVPNDVEISPSKKSRLSLALPPSSTNRDEDIYEDKNSKNYNLSLRYNYGKFISIENNYADLELFLPLLQRWLFLDGRGYWFDNRQWGANASIGARRCVDPNHVIGINASYDFLRGSCRSNFSRIGIGGEWFYKYAEVRINAYLPVWEKYNDCHYCFFDLGDGLFASQTTYLSAYNGFDATLGLFIWESEKMNLYIEGGTYYFHQHCLPTFWGGSFKFRFDWRSLFFLQMQLSLDPVYHANIQGMAGISIPLDFVFSKKNKNICNVKLDQNIQRNGIILTRKYCNWMWNWDDKN